MKGTILSIDVHGVETVTEVNGEPTLDLLKAAIGGGYIEIVPGFTTYNDGTAVRDCVAFVDEEGKLKGQPLNGPATYRWERALRRAGHPGLYGDDGQAKDVLVGRVAIVWGDEAFMRAL